MFRVGEIEHVALGWEIKIGDGVTADMSIFVNEVKFAKGNKIVAGEFTDLLQESEAEQDIMLPTEMVRIINGTVQETSWSKINVGKVMKYITDMMEK